MSAAKSTPTDDLARLMGGRTLPAVPPPPPIKDSAEQRSKRAFFGRSGHLAVMAEFLYRQINVAIPEVDVGDDVFVVKGREHSVTRVQVKAANARDQKKSYQGRFVVSKDQLSVPSDAPPLVFVFALRRAGRWSDFIVIGREALFALQAAGAGYPVVDADTQKESVEFRINFSQSSAQCLPKPSHDFQQYRDAWDPWPPPPSSAEPKRDAAKGSRSHGSPKRRLSR
jgi:hypothetical protein